MSKVPFTRLAAWFAAIILLQTLYFKFSAHPDSVYIFSALGMEPYGRIGVGVAELLTAILLLVPRFSAWGALLGLGTISGAIFFHLAILGLVINNDGGKLFVLALLVFFACAYILWKEWRKLPIDRFLGLLRR
jgi:putative oxidoreductase